MTTQLHLEAQRPAQVEIPPRIINRLLRYLALNPLLIVAYQNLLVPLGGLAPLPLSEPGLAMFVALFSLLHSLYLFGWRNTLVLFGITVVISWSFEQVGVASGLIYGVYHYSDAMGPKLGHVPYAIPVAWYSMLYLSYVMTLLITEGVARFTQPVIKTVTHTDWGTLLWQALVSGMVLTAWDVLVDPLASGPTVLSWVWEHGGAYYGVPNQNFAGWVLTGFTVILLYGIYNSRFPARPLGSWTRPVLTLPLLVYGLIMLQLMLRRDAPSEWTVLAAFVMGFPLVATLSQLRQKI